MAEQGFCFLAAQGFLAEQGFWPEQGFACADGVQGLLDAACEASAGLAAATAPIARAAPRVSADRVNDFFMGLSGRR